MKSYWNPSEILGEILVSATWDDGFRRNTIVSVGVYCRVRQNRVVLRHRFPCKRCSFFAVYDTASYDRNPVHTKRVIYGPYTVVILSITTGYVIVNVRMRSFTVVVMIDLGTHYRPASSNIINVVQQLKQQAQVRRQAMATKVTCIQRKVVEVIPRNVNGTYTCPACNKMFKPQGITKHVKSCSRTWCQQNNIK